MSQKIKAIVIKKSDKKEKDLNVLLFSLELGKIWVTLKGVKQPKAKMKSASFMFAFGDFVLEEGKSGKIVTAFDCVESFHEISEDVDKFFEAASAVEVVDKLEFENKSECAQVFVLLLKTLKSICFSSTKREYALCKFLIELLSLFGMGLFSEKCTCCGNRAVERFFVDLSTGELVCAGCKTYACEEFPKTALVALKILSNTDFENLSTLTFAQNSEIVLLKILVKIFENRLNLKLKMIGIL